MFGLGDNTFPNFNKCSKIYYKYFKMYGMVEFHPYDIGSNHNGNIESDFTEWMGNLIKCLKNN